MHFRPVEVEDAAEIHQLAATDTRLRFRGSKSNELGEWQNAFYKAQDRTHRFVGCEDGTIAAYVTLSHLVMPRLEHSARIGLPLIHPGQANGESVALQHAIEFARLWLGIRRLFCVPVEGDERLCQALEGLGFESRVRERQSAFVEGRYQDRLFYDWVDPQLLARDLSNRIGPDTRAPAADLMKGDLLIRAPTPSDARDIAAMMTEPEACAGTLQLPSREFSSFEEQYAKSSPQALRLVGVIGGKVIARAELFEPSERHLRHAAAMVLVVSRRAWGRGVGRAMLRAILSAGFQDAGLRVINLSVYRINTAAVDLYKSEGFVFEGTLRCHAYVLGGYVDSICMSMTRDEYAARVVGQRHNET